ncbi:PucR family transcriptional regulator [Timonella senegalensis]|uniref:PucR family transcriptional regulator n=1 Tax=Timonella senegalensis TaxID=1465825 RepID=UPI0028B0C18C|nr:helix-turn-helix domain-containing protein [Timonella senegalensis]
METPDPHNLAASGSLGENQQRVKDGAGLLTSAALKKLDEDLPWYRALPKEDRAWVSVVAQSGISSFVSWFINPELGVQSAGDMFAAAPPDLIRSISLQHTLQIVRCAVEVVEAYSDRLAAPGQEQNLKEAVLRYSREVAFEAAEVYARAAEVRGAWDARLEALVVDAIVRGDRDKSLRSRVSALGWSGVGKVLVMVGSTAPQFDDLRSADLRRAVRRLVQDVLVGIQGDRIVLVLGGDGDLFTAAQSLTPRFGEGPVIIGPTVASLDDAPRSASAALAALESISAWPGAPRPVAADELLPERMLIGDPLARGTLIAQAYDPLSASGGALLETLSAYLGTGRSLEGAARDLYVHPNTVRYRLRKVAEITGWDPLDARESFVLQVALAAGRLPAEF